MPTATSVPHPTVQWWRDVSYPVRPNLPTQGHTAQVQTSVGLNGAGHQFGLSGGAGPQPIWRQLAGTTGLTVNDFRQVGQLYANRQASADATGVTARYGFRFPTWTPQIGNAASLPAEDDDAHRIAWLQIGLFSDAAVPVTADDTVGIHVCPDDGSGAASWAPITGGLCITQKAGTQDWEYQSFGVGPVLLEAIDLTPGAGWHVADLIIRQGRRSDPLTPWLTLRWDNVDVFTARPFGGALLASPQSILAAAQAWWLVMGGRLATHPWHCTSYWRFRQGSFHPDGYPIT